jgi:hypothetical protein
MESGTCLVCFSMYFQHAGDPRAFLEPAHPPARTLLENAHVPRISTGTGTTCMCVAVCASSYEQSKEVDAAEQSKVDAAEQRDMHG